MVVWIQNHDKFIVLMENIRYEVWLQNQDKFVTQCTIVLIRKNIGSIKFISGEASTVYNCPNTKISGQ
jgi:hypothetical protein